MMNTCDRSDIKIRFFNPEFYINEKKQTVTCKLHFRVEAPYIIRVLTKCCLAKTVIATATLKNNDVFNVNVGKKVALAKAENMAYSIANNLITDAYKNILNATKAISDFRYKATRVKEHNIEYMKKF